MQNPVQDLSGWGVMPKRPGLYLSLSHGRDFPQQAMTGRGFAGPKIGPLLYVRTRYGQEVIVRFVNKRDAAKFFPAATEAIQALQVVEGTLVYQDKCFGDWDVCFIDALFCSTAPQISTSPRLRKYSKVGS